MSAVQQKYFTLLLIVQEGDREGLECIQCQKDVSKLLIKTVPQHTGVKRFGVWGVCVLGTVNTDKYRRDINIRID
jgi:hypothetical protein